MRRLARETPDAAALARAREALQTITSTEVSGAAGGILAHDATLRDHVAAVVGLGLAGQQGPPALPLAQSEAPRTPHPALPPGVPPCPCPPRCSLRHIGAAEIRRRHTEYVARNDRRKPETAPLQVDFAIDELKRSEKTLRAHLRHLGLTWPL